MIWVVLLLSLVVMGVAAARATAREARLRWLSGLVVLAALAAWLRFGARALMVVALPGAWLLWQTLQSRTRAAPPHGGARNMTRQQALRVLGLEEGASQEAIAAAHRSLIKKVHPDQGGSGFLAQQVNEAKKVLDGS